MTENNTKVLKSKKLTTLVMIILAIIGGFLLLITLLGILVNLLFTYNEGVYQLKGTTNSLFRMVPHVMSIIIVTVILLALMVIINRKIVKANPLEKPKGVVLVVLIFVSTIEKFVSDTMGEKMKPFAPYVGYLGIYLFAANVFGLLGFTPPPTSSFSVTFAFGISTFFIIRYYGIKYHGFGHIKGIFQPILLSPINLVGEVALPFTLSIRLFGNILSGTLIMTLVYAGLSGAFNLLLSAVFGSNLGGIGELFAPFVGAPFLHIYFDIFSGFIQTFVFILLSSVFISNAAN